MTDTTADRGFTAVEVPWMKIGTRVDGAVSAAEAIQMAGLDWEVEARDAGFRDRDGNWQVHPGRKAMVRADTDQPLGNMADAYELVQYREAFDVLDRISPKFVAAGPLVGGKQAFMVVQAPEHTRIDLLDGQDPHELYVIGRTSHDGSRGIELSLQLLRGKCMNQLTLPSLTAGAHQRVSFRHTRSVHQKLEQAHQLFVNLEAYSKDVQRTATQLAAIDLELDEARRLLDEQVVPKDLKSHEQRVDRIMSLYQNSPLNGHAGNGWGLLNAVSEYHEYHHGGDRRRPATRLLQGLGGSTQEAVTRTVAALRRAR